MSILALCLVIVGVLGAVSYRVFYGGSEGVDAEDLIVEVASRGAFDHIVLEQGEIEIEILNGIALESVEDGEERSVHE